MGYDIPKSYFSTNLELTHTQGSGNLNSSSGAIPSANILTFTLTYSFD